MANDKMCWIEVAIIFCQYQILYASYAATVILFKSVELIIIINDNGTVMSKVLMLHTFVTLLFLM